MLRLLTLWLAAAYTRKDCSEKSAVKLVIVVDISYSVLNKQDLLRRLLEVAQSVLVRLRTETEHLHWGLVLFASNSRKISEIDLFDERPIRFDGFDDLKRFIADESLFFGGHTNYEKALKMAKKMLQEYPDAKVKTGNVRSVKSQIILLTDGMPTDLNDIDKMEKFRNNHLAGINVGAALLTHKLSWSLKEVYRRVVTVPYSLKLLKTLCRERAGSHSLIADNVNEWTANMFGKFVREYLCEQPVAATSTSYPAPSFTTEGSGKEHEKKSEEGYEKEEPENKSGGESGEGSGKEPENSEKGYEKEPEKKSGDGYENKSGKEPEKKSGEGSDDEDEDENGNGGTILLIVLTVVGLLLLLCCIVVIYRWKSKQPQETSCVNFKATSKSTEP